ncbi:MFS transporter [Alloacidobacterium dinghuense]|uniref:MFS transporter n=1 Tax=Alloacidobacterium dinghuense TaxID=2763107 RepID=A0A7G8BNF0_9BACT|nr:MFS transporter [Alloacidobacterium dinghuense]QNI34070.1 MFS transporter [Alloacidobacterium dinghuense]
MPGWAPTAGMVNSLNGENKPSAQVVAALYLGFVLTGIGTNLLGCILPALSGIWGLSDSHSGFLFAAQFAGSSTGALLMQSDLFKSIVRGYVLLILGSIAFAFCRGHLAPLILFCYGLGLGSAMTAISMIFGRMYTTNRGASLSLLNAFWGLGAVVCPMLATVWERFESANSIYLGLALAAVLPLFALALQYRYVSQLRDEITVVSNRHTKFSLLVPLAIFAFLYVGVESSISGWMMTYVHRLPLASGLYAPIATSFFWIALLVGRSVAPAVLKRISESGLLMITLCVVLVSNVMLLLSYTPAMSITSAALAGLMLAPIFPLCLSKVLAIASGPSESRWVFAISGLGGAVLPWMTGQVASLSGSLRTGLAVPLVAAIVMLLLQVRTQRVLGRG